jgi:hypothetical protein
VVAIRLFRAVSLRQSVSCHTQCILLANERVVMGGGGLKFCTAGPPSHGPHIFKVFCLHTHVKSVSSLMKLDRCLNTLITKFCILRQILSKRFQIFYSLIRQKQAGSAWFGFHRYIIIGIIDIYRITSWIFEAFWDVVVIILFRKEFSDAFYSSPH